MTQRWESLSRKTYNCLSKEKEERKNVDFRRKKMKFYFQDEIGLFDRVATLLKYTCDHANYHPSDDRDVYYSARESWNSLETISQTAFITLESRNQSQRTSILWDINEHDSYETTVRLPRDPRVQSREDNSKLNPKS